MTGNHRLNEDSVLQLLQTGNYEDQSTNPDDPLTERTIPVTLDKLRPYDNNPRTIRNPNFREILISIENSGLKQPPTITRRHPDDPYYMIADGGNTRLEILKILHQKYRSLAEDAESEEEQSALSEKAQSFYMLDCRYVPWVNESNALVGHMSENESRGNMRFIEKAIAVEKLRNYFMEEDLKNAQEEGIAFDQTPLSMGVLAKRITSLGWTVGKSHLSRYGYAANTLMGALPKCFWAGAGHNFVRTIRKIETSYHQFWLSTSTGKEDPDRIKSLFLEILALYDGESIDIRSFQDELNEKLGNILGMDPTLVMIEVDSIIGGSSGLKLDASDRENLASLTTMNQFSSSDVNEPIQSPAKKPKPDAKAEPKSIETAPSPQIPDKPQIAHHGVIALVRQFASKYGIEILSEVCESEAEQALKGIPFGVLPINKAFVPDTDDVTAAIWWSLTKFSLSFKVSASEDHFIHALKNMYGLYLVDKTPIGVLLFLEEVTQRLPHDILQELMDIQRLCALYIQRSHDK